MVLRSCLCCLGIQGLLLMGLLGLERALQPAPSPPGPLITVRQV